MWIRSAFWTGRPKSGAETAFASAINEELTPALKALPGVQDAKALWPRRLEDDPPGLHCQILVYFASLADVDRMLASPERLALRSRVREVADLFDGAISHIDYEVA
ncbi:hypothetical protein GG804_06540 [Sphingomonas histidinilytica]|uniref:hypothetical protein n=1 Tax=Rhizorhabdus histidinilytica TaxID=439228 RepID=UPI001ADD29B7|nr:hypothetical protein [Rhizorhabdus histidinilytica]MBO9376420.1 hypothetical protein [Rhizorhabdus histidinilytica]